MKIVHKAVITGLTRALAPVATLDNDTEIHLSSDFVRRFRPQVGGTIIVLANCDVSYQQVVEEGEEVEEVKPSISRLQTMINEFSPLAQIAIQLKLRDASDPQHFIEHVRAFDQEGFKIFQAEMEEEATAVQDLTPTQIDELMACDEDDLIALNDLDQGEHDELVEHLAKLEESRNNKKTVNAGTGKQDHAV